MEIRPLTGSITEQDVDAVIICLFEDQMPHGATEAVDEKLGGAISELIEAGDFTGKTKQVAVLYPRGVIPARRVILVGFGKQDDFSVEILRRALAQGVQKARDLKARAVATVTAGTGLGGLDVATSAQAITEGVLLGLYSFTDMKSDDESDDLPELLNLLPYGEDEIPAVEQGVAVGAAMANGATLTRDLVNMPPNFCTPAYMAQVAAEMGADVGLKVTVLEDHQMEALKMGALLAVAQGSDSRPRFIILEHNADKAGELDTLVLAGKGVTFDTGGYNAKSAEGMLKMKSDMAGAAAVIGAMRIVAELDLPLHVVGLAPASDNMINGHAYRPSEVVTASNGKTIEVMNTDAEGRMLLADALVYAKRYDPAAVVDIATLTGACVVALGTASAGMFSTDDLLRDRLLAAGGATGERVWPLPLFPEYSKAVESKVADIKNTGGRMGGVGTSAAFLKNFVDYPAWAHVDMAGMALEAKDNPYMPGEGATGYGARLLAEFVRQWAE